MAGYDTNLAAEYYVMSCLHRLGVTASLTLGNKKGVDILVAREDGDAVSVEVKGVAKRYDWPANNIQSNKPHTHFIALICFEGEIDLLTMPAPRVWIVPLLELEKFKRSYKGGRVNISKAVISSEGSIYENAWHLIDPQIKAK
jgi:hypothetical protein